jgi:hypothetical protein
VLLNGQLPPDFDANGTQTKKNMLSLKSQYRNSKPSFKITAATILEIQVRAIKWAITT